MFMKFTESSSANPDNTYGYGGAGSAPKWVDTLEHVMFLLEFALNAFTILLNVSVILVLWRATRPEYKACFYIIMRTFNIFVALNALGTLITLVHRKADDFQESWYIQVILILNMFTCIASSLWLFYAGLNRMMVLVYPHKLSDAWGCRIVRGTLTGVALLALLLSFAYQKVCKVYTRYDATTNTVQMIASDMAEILTIFVYAFPLFSIVFYVVAYKNLQEKRLLVTSDKTKAIIDQAEGKTLKIGTIILITYTLSLAVHLFIIFVVLKDEEFASLFNRIDEIVGCAPQIALPIALLSCNKKLISGAFNTKRSSVSNSATVRELYANGSFTKEKRNSLTKAKTSSTSNS